MAEEKDTRSRKWLLTINDPIEKGYTNELIGEKVQSFASFRYACYSHEIGCENHRYHIHIFVAFDNVVRFSTIKGVFPEAHIDACKGSIKENRDYVFKDGKWKGSEKEDSRQEGMQFEVGTMPIEIGQGHRTDIDKLEEYIDAGMTPNQIFALSMSYRNFEKQIRAQYMAKRVRETPTVRDITVVWHVGESGMLNGKFLLPETLQSSQNKIFISKVKPLQCAVNYGTLFSCITSRMKYHIGVAQK